MTEFRKGDRVKVEFEATYGYRHIEFEDVVWVRGKMPGWIGVPSGALMLIKTTEDEALDALANAIDDELSAYGPDAPTRRSAFAVVEHLLNHPQVAAALGLGRSTRLVEAEA